MGLWYSLDNKKGGSEKLTKYDSPELNTKGSKLLYDIMIFSGDLGGKPDFNLTGDLAGRKITIDVNINIEEKRDNK